MTDATFDVEDRPVEEDRAPGAGTVRADDPRTDAPDDTDGSGRPDDDASDPPKRSLFKRPLFWIILLSVVAVLGVGGLLYYQDAQKYESTDNAFVDAHIVRLAPQVAGTLVQVADVDNRRVRAGELLAEIKPSGQQDQLAEANANIAQAREQYAASLSQVGAAQAQRQQAASQALAPIADATAAQDNLARLLALRRLDPGAVAAQTIDDARAAARRTAALADAARAAIRSAGAGVDVARQQANATRSAIATRQAQAAQSQTTVGNLRVTAPVAGQVVNRQVSVGSYVAPGTQLMAIVPNRLWITANFKETQLARMRVGQPVSIRIDAFPDVEFKGRVDSFQNGAGQAFALLPPQNATGNYVKVVQRVPVRITFDIKNGPDPRQYPIGPGMSAVPTVTVE